MVTVSLQRLSSEPFLDHQRHHVLVLEDVMVLGSFFQLLAVLGPDNEGVRGGADPSPTHQLGSAALPENHIAQVLEDPGGPFSQGWDVGWEEMIYAMENYGMEWNGVE